MFRRHPPVCFRRRYATIDNIANHHDRLQLNKWPTSKNPTPQELFHLAAADFNLSTLEFNKLIKKTYSKYLKIYHPDILNQADVHDEKNNLMSPELKRQRFDLIQSAYEILKDPKRRVAYGRYRTTEWENYSPQASSFESFRMANAHRRKYDFANDEQFWTASNWEDYYNMKYNRKPPTREEFDKNKFKILAAVLIIGGLVTSIEFMVAFSRFQEAQRQANLNHLRSLQDLNNSYAINEPNTRFNRVRRLLMHRRAGEQDDEVLKLKEQEDAELLTQYARQQIAKMD